MCRQGASSDALGTEKPAAFRDAWGECGQIPAGAGSLAPRAAARPGEAAGWRAVDGDGRFPANLFTCPWHIARVPGFFR
ncbi:hypothetical protein GCM10028832_15430 [Streptomyces sparsus]